MSHDSSRARDKILLPLPIIPSQFFCNWEEYRKGRVIAHSVIAMPGSFVPITQPETIIIIGTAAAPAAAVEKGNRHPRGDGSERHGSG